MYLTPGIFDSKKEKMYILVCSKPANVGTHEPKSSVRRAGAMQQPSRITTKRKLRKYK